MALGDVDQVDARSDVFSLGAILAEFLTSRPAYAAEESDGRELLERAKEGDLAPARDRLGSCEGDRALVELALDCLSASPSERPADAGEVAAATALLAAAGRDIPGLDRPIEPPAWLRKETLQDSQSSVEERTGELHARLRAGLAGPGAAADPCARPCGRAA